MILRAMATRDLATLRFGLGLRMAPPVHGTNRSVPYSLSPRRTRPGSLAMFATMRRASSLVSKLSAYGSIPIADVREQAQVTKAHRTASRTDRYIHSLPRTTLMVSKPFGGRGGENNHDRPRNTFNDGSVGWTAIQSGNSTIKII